MQNWLAKEIIPVPTPLVFFTTITVFLSAMQLQGGEPSSANAPVRVNSTKNNPVETTIAINPTRISNIIGGAFGTTQVDGEKRITNFTFVSTDDGRTWTQLGVLNRRRSTQGDDAVCFDGTGIAYRSYLSFKGLHNAKQVNYNSILVSRSSDVGFTWSEPVSVALNPTADTPFEDKPYITCDLTDSPFRNSLYISWTQFTRYGSMAPSDSSFVFFARSTDRGETFSQPLRISEAGGDATDGDGTVEGAVPAVGPEGDVYVAWGSKDGIIITRSTDGGMTFSTNRLVVDTPGGWSMSIGGLTRCNGMPVTGCDISNSAFRGRVYVNWVDNRYASGNGNDHDVFLIHSDDEGRTWSKVTRVNNDSFQNGRDQFLTWMSVDPADGSVNILFMDRRNHGGDTTEVFFARSEDGGQTFSNVKVGGPFLPTTEKFLGDYVGISAYSRRVAMLWPEFVAGSINAYSLVIDH